MPASKKQSKKKELTLKQLRFILEYLIDQNAAQAYIRAGYAAKNAETAGPRLSRNVQVKAEIDKRMAKIFKELEVTKENTTRELAGLAHSNIEDYVEIEEVTGAVRVKAFKDMPKGASRAIKSIKEKRRVLSTPAGDAILETTLEFQLYDKIRPNELLGKDMGMFTDKVEVKGKVDLITPTGLSELTKVLGALRGE